MSAWWCIFSSAAGATLLLLACSAPAQRESANGSATRQDKAAAAAERPQLYGRWRIVEVNGAPARSLAGDPKVQPNVSFSQADYGGTTGCNGFGGIGLVLGDRWFGDSPMATQQGCGDLTEQETSIFEILAGGPTMMWSGRDTVLLRTPTGTLRLERTGDAPEPGRGEAPMQLAGSRWELFAVDGKALDLPGARQPARMTFEADRWTLETPCAVHGGPWRQVDQAALLEPAAPTRVACSAALAAPSKALAAALTGKLHFVVGPNGELLATNGANWVTGRRDVTFTRGEGNLLTGEWRIVAVDGASPPAQERPATLLVGPRAYGIWDGCMHSEGVSIVADRQLFTHGSGVVTLANCPKDEIRQKINAVVAASPRIARTVDGGLALVSSIGTLRMNRLSTRAFGPATGAQLKAGTSFRLLAGADSARLALGPGDAFSVTLPCGMFSGRWQNRRGFGTDFARFSPERPPAGCSEASAGMRLYNFLTGNVLAAVGPNRDIALFVNNGRSVPARVEAGQTD